MRRRLLTWLGLGVMWLVFSVSGVAAGLLGTRAGRDVLVSTITQLVNRGITGSVSFGQVAGSPWSGLIVSDLRVRAPDGGTVATVDSITVRFGIRDVLSGRITFGRLGVHHASVDLIQPALGEPFTLLAAFASAEPSDPSETEAPPLIAFRNVVLRDARVTVRTPAGPADSLAEVEEGPMGPLRVRTIANVNADLPLLQISSPLDPDGPIRIEVAAFAAAMSDPAIDVHDAVGFVELWADSVRVDLSPVRLTGSTLDLEGSLAWPDGGLLMELVARGYPIETDDLLGLVAAVPTGLIGAGIARVHSETSSVLIVDLDSLDLEGVGGGGQVRGRLGMRLSETGGWGQRATDLALSGFDLEYIRHLVDTLPLAGRVSGRFRADGPQEDLQLGLDVVFRDSLIRGRPRNAVRGQGRVALGEAGDFRFREFRLDHVDLSLQTVQRIVPAILLEGRLSGSGVLNGPWLEAEYRGTLRHRDAPLAETRAAGTLQIDATDSIVGVWASLSFDSLQLAGLETTFPQLPMQSSFAGRLYVAGYMDSLFLDAQLDGPAGTIRARGPLFFGPDSLGAHELAVELSQFNPNVLRPDVPQMELNGMLSSAGWWRDSLAMQVAATGALGRSDIAGAPIDSLVAALRYAGDRIELDTLEVEGFRLRASAAGSLGGPRGGDHQLRFTAETDSLGVLEDWLVRWFGPRAESDTIPASGRVRVTGTLAGSLDAPDLVANVTAVRVRRGQVRIVRAVAGASVTAPEREVAATVTVDSAIVGNHGLGDLALRVTGYADSASWTLGSRVRTVARLDGSGDWWRAGAGFVVSVDSLRAALAQGTWRARGGSVTWSDSGVTLSGLEIAIEGGAGRITVGGRFPFRGPGDLTASVESIPLQDLWLLMGRPHEDVAGWLGGTFQFAGTARAPVMSGLVGIREVTFGQFSVPQMTGVLRYEDQRLVGNLEARRLGEPIVNADVMLPVDLSVTGAERRRLPGPLSLRARADSVDLTLVNALIPQIRQVTGVLDADFGLTGTWEDPELTGSFDIRRAGAVLPALGVRYEALNAHFTLRADSILVDSLTVRTGRGQARMDGFVRLEELSRAVVDLRVRARDFQTANIRNFLTLVASGDVRLTGPVIGATLRGDATVTRGVLYFADLLNKEVVDLDNPLYSEWLDTTEIREEQLGSSFQVRLLDSLRIDGLELEMSRETWLRSTEANIQLAGELVVDREGDEFRLTGDLETPRGFYRFEMLPTVTREFQVTGGAVRYFGTPDLNADLDVRAQHVVRQRRGDNVTVSVHIGGTVYEPLLTLSSDVNPPLSETEIISYLLFGAPSVQEREAQQTTELVTERVVGALSGQLGSVLISDVGIPLDYVQIRPASSGGVLGLEGDFGKQFTIFGRPAFLAASPLICARERVQFGASLEYRLTRRWLLAASVDPARRCSYSSETTLRYQFGLDLFWEMGY